MIYAQQEFFTPNISLKTVDFVWLWIRAKRKQTMLLKLLLSSLFEIEIILQACFYKKFLSSPFR